MEERKERNKGRRTETTVCQSSSEEGRGKSMQTLDLHVCMQSCSITDLPLPAVAWEKVTVDKKDQGVRNNRLSHKWWKYGIWVALVPQSCHTIYHKLGGLKHPKFILSQFCRLAVQNSAPYEVQGGIGSLLFLASSLCLVLLMSLPYNWITSISAPIGNNVFHIQNKYQLDGGKQQIFCQSQEMNRYGRDIYSLKQELFKYNKKQTVKK